MVERTCATPGCDKPHRARGLCSTHYNRTYAPDRHRTDKVCEACGTGYTTTRTNGRYCSLACRDAESRARKAAREAARRARPQRDPRTPLRRAVEECDPQGVLAAIRSRSVETESGCWEWQGTVKDGYPVVTWRSGARAVWNYVHRLALEARLGKPLGAQPAHHSCANTVCANPDHLQAVTHRENAAEMMARRYMIGRIVELEAALAQLAPDHALLAEVSVPALGG